MQVPLGLILKNENSRDEMLEILMTLHKYVPNKSTTGKFLRILSK